MRNIEKNHALKTWSDSNYDHFSKVKNRDKDAYRRFKAPCFFQSAGYVSNQKEVSNGKSELE